MKITGRIFAVAAVLWMMLIFSFSAQNVNASRNVSYDIVSWILNILEPGQHTVVLENQSSDYITVFENIPSHQSDNPVMPVDSSTIPDITVPNNDKTDTEDVQTVMPPEDRAYGQKEENTDISPTENEVPVETPPEKEPQESVRPMPAPKKDWFGISRGLFASFIRKTAHFILFGVLGVLVCVAFFCETNKKWMRSVLMSCIICAAYSVFDEIHQLFVDGRTAQISDVAIDLLGSLCGIFIAVSVIATVSFIRKKLSRPDKKAEL